MKNTYFYRSIVHEEDAISIKNIIKKTRIFDREEVGFIDDMIKEALTQQKQPASSDPYRYHFILLDHADETIAFACFGQIPATNKRFDLYWIVVSPEHQRKNIGQTLLNKTENHIIELGGVAIYVQTSGTEHYTQARLFYEKNKYIQVANINDYYKKCDALVIYKKTLKEER